MGMNVSFNRGRVDRLFDGTIGQRNRSGKNWNHAVGSDIGGTNIRLAVVNLRTGNLATEPRIIEMAMFNDYDSLVRAVNEAKASIVESSGLTVDGAATGFPAAVDREGKVRFAPPNVKFPIDPDFGKHTDQLVVNDGNAIITGVAFYDPTGSNKESFVGILPGTGLGTAAIDGDHLILPFAFEGGHIKLDYKSHDKCGCGSTGCAETVISGPGLMRTARKMFRDNVFTSLGWSRPEDIAVDWIQGGKNAALVMRIIAHNTVNFLSTLDAFFLSDAYFFGEGFLRDAGMVNKFIGYVKEDLERPNQISFERQEQVSNNLYPIQLEYPGIKGAAVIAAQNALGLWP